MKKRYKILIGILIVPALLIVVSALIFYSSSFQTYITKKISSYYSSELKTKIKIGSVDFKFFKTFILNDVLILDKKADTLLNICKLDIDIDSLYFSEKKYFVNRITFTKTEINSKTDIYGKNNYDFLIDYFSNSDTIQGNSSTSKYELTCNNISFDNSHINYSTQYIDTTSNTNLTKTTSFSNLNIDIENIISNQDFQSFKISNLTFLTKNNLLVKKINFGIYISQTDTEVKNLKIETENSNILIDSLILKYHSFEDFANFTDKVNCTISINNTTSINTNDLYLFDNKFKNSKETVSINGKIFGFVNSLDIKDFNIKPGHSNFIGFSAVISNIMNIKSMEYCFSGTNITLKKSEIEDMNLEEILGKEIKFPKELKSLENLSYTGIISGNLNSVKLEGKIITNIGELNISTVLSKDTVSGITEINAKFTCPYLNISSFTQNQYITNIGMFGNAVLKMDSTGLKAMQTNLNINHIKSYKYTYNKIKLKAEYINKKIKTQIESNDSNAVFSAIFEGDFSNKIPKYNLNFDITKLDLYNTKLDTIREHSSIKGSFAGSVTGDNIDNYTGFIGANDVLYKTGNDSIPLTNLIFTSEHTGYERILKVSSEYFDIDIRGTYNFKTLEHAFNKFISAYIPSYYNENQEADLKEDNMRIINFTADFYNIDKINKYFFPDINIGKGSHIEAFFRTNDAKLDFYTKIPEITLDNNKIYNFEVTAQTENNTLTIDAKCKLSLYDNTYIIDQVYYSGILSKDSLLSVLSWHNSDTLVYGGDIYAKTSFKKKKPDSQVNIKTEIRPTEITLANNTWDVTGNTIIYDNSEISLLGLKLSEGVQKIEMDGKISKNPKTPLNLTITNYDISDLNRFIANKNINISGQFTGMIELYNLMQKPTFTVVSAIQNLKINKENFGDVSLVTELDTLNKRIFIDAEASNGENTFDMEGYYYDNEDVYLTAVIKKLNVKIIEPFFEGSASVKAGIANGTCNVSGTTKDIFWSAVLNIDDAIFNVNYLDADFKISSLIAIDNHNLQIATTDIYDSENNKAVFSLNSTHENLDNFNFDIDFATDKFLVLNTNAGTTEDYYGTLYTQGISKIKGNLDKLNIGANLTTLEGSDLFLTSGNELLSDKFDFLEFKKSETIQTETIVKEDFTGINLNLDLTISPETKLNIIIDPATNNNMTAQGLGKLNFETDELNNIEIYGDYILSKGKYNFSIENLYNMEFLIDPGSKLIWNGSPDDAQINITAIYKIRKANLFNLLREEDVRDIFIPVDCDIYLKNTLLKPKISFGVNITERTKSAATMLKNLPEEQINKQFLSLLILGKFLPLPGVNAQQAPEDNSSFSASEILAGQLGTAITAMNSNVDVGVKYKQKSQTSAEEIELDFSTSFLDEKVVLNGNVAKGNYNNSTTDIVGDFDAEVKLSKQGKIKLKVYNKSNRNFNFDTGPYTQGIGFFLRHEFDAVLRKKIRIKNDK